MPQKAERSFGGKGEAAKNLTTLMKKGAFKTLNKINRPFIIKKNKNINKEVS